MYFYCYVKNVLYICSVKTKEIITIKTLKIMTTDFKFGKKQVKATLVTVVVDGQLYVNTREKIAILLKRDGNILKIDNVPAIYIDRLKKNKNSNEYWRTIHTLLRGFDFLSF